MTKNHKIINIEDVEMIDSYYFFIKKEPKFFCLEIINTNSSKERKNLLNKTMIKDPIKYNDIAIASYLFTENDEIKSKLLYSSDSLKSLKNYTDNIILAEEGQIIEFISNLNRD